MKKISMSVNDTIRMYKKGNITMYKIVHGYTLKNTFFFVILYSRMEVTNEKFERRTAMFENRKYKT